MATDILLPQNWEARRLTGTSAPDTLAIDYGYLRPPVDIFAIAARLGVEIRAIKENTNINADGCLLLHENQPFILIQPEHSLVQQRFTVARLLGHLLLHELQEVRSIGRVNSSEKEEAERFALELLMPTYLLRSEEPGTPVNTLARVFGVTLATLNRRLHELYGLSKL